MRKKKPVDDFQFTITKVSDNPDGSANCVCDMSEFVAGKLIEIGVITLLKEYIDQEKKKQNGSA
jgi:hypothetical protein